jgi:hypothetical protein
MVLIARQNKGERGDTKLKSEVQSANAKYIVEPIVPTVEIITKVR